MDERAKRVLIAAALGFIVGFISYQLDKEFERLKISQASTILDNLIVGLASGLCAYGWASYLAEGQFRHEAAEKLRQEGILRERTRVACEIHDTLAQSFVGMVLNLEAAQDLLEKNKEPYRLCERALRLGKEGLAEARSMVRGLRSEVLQEGTLREAITQLVTSLTDDAGLRIECSIEEIPACLSPDTETQLLRILHEAITNVVRHANASEMKVSLCADRGQIQLCVEDDGRGFLPAHALDRETFGLTSMSERAKNLRGTLWVYSQPDQGTQVVALIPIPDPSNEGAPHAESWAYSSGDRR